jgi:hypothetical protein
MSDNDPKDGEIISPNAVTRVAKNAVRRVDKRLDNNPEGVVDSAVTAFVAGLRRRANSALAANAHARADYFDAMGRVAKSYIGMHQALDETEELDAILELDRKERTSQRAERDKEITHGETLAELRRKQELTEAQRGVFNAELGFENQQRLKQMNLETWEKRKEVDHLDAATLAARLRGEAEPKKKRRKLLPELQAQADNLEKEILELLADGKETEADLMALAKLKALIAWLASNKKAPGEYPGD